MKDLLSYAVGCMFGRYSLDKPGLLLANQGQTIADYHAQIPTPSFPPDQDNVLPILDGDWFIDDISDRFRKFLRVTFGDQHYEENLKFIETALGKDIRKYFLKDFYNDHLKRYKKRPIYWLFSSPKGSFQALIYLHRYRPDTVSIVLNDYLREFSAKLNARVANLRRLEVSADASPAEKTKAIKEIEKLNKTIEELNDYEREVLYPLAIQQIQIDLDDGVKVNYQKFGAALKKIPGLETKEGD
jgi:type II restriction/modification system DNA methylase subunit YeeA